MKIKFTTLDTKNLSMTEIERYAQNIGGELMDRFLKFEGAWNALMESGENPCGPGYFPPWSSGFWSRPREITHWSEVERNSATLKALRQELDL